MIGTPVARQDAPLKVTGEARYLADLEVPGALEGVFVTAPVGAGRITGIDAEAALAVPGVARVLGPGDLGEIAPLDHWAAGQGTVPLGDGDIRHEGQPIALVLATSRLAAIEGARLVRITIEPAPVRFDLEALRSEAVEVKDWAPARTAVGSAEAGLAGADVVIAATYRTADRHHAAIEPSAVVARWDGDELELWTSTQWVFGVRAAMSQVFAIPAERIRVRAPFVGGGFGGKGSCWAHEILAAAAARVVGAPVRIVLTRREAFTGQGHQPATVQEVTLGARRDGILTAIRHHCWNAAAMTDDYVEHGSLGSRGMYACPNVETADLIVRLHRPQPTFMRAPHEGPGMAALEIAMDELAGSLGIDPIDLRVRNHASAHPTTGKPYSSKALLDCYRLGAERFGWSDRPPVPGTRVDGAELVGYGMASAMMSTFRFGAAARVTVRRDGSLLVETAAHEIGSGARTMIAQIAAAGLGIPIERVEVVLGDTSLPEAGGTFGSATTLSVGSAVEIASRRLRERLDDLAGEPGLEPREYPELLALHRLDLVSEEGAWAPRREENAFAMAAFGAVFVEVRVGRIVPVPRVTRVVGVYSVGRIISPTLARSQVVGGIIWGLGQALCEGSRIDPGTGRFLGKGFGGYHVPSAADIPAIDVEFAAERDPHASPLGARGVGEIGTIGVGAAVANAIFNATGHRHRRLPIELR